ncbi:MAG: glycosyltransferase family 2 protein [Candidatus Daviesbacteria bacterium]
MKKVAVVVLNFEVGEQTINCVESIKKSTYKNLEIIIIDNSPDDGLAEMAKRISEVYFIQNQENLGYCGGNNVGIKKAISNGADYIFVLNPDTTVEKDAIASLVNTAELENAGICGPKVLFSDRKTIWYGGGILDAKNVLGKHRGLDEKDIGQYDTVEETEFVTGGAMFVSRNVFAKIGFFDEKYFMYLEDPDFCLRAKKAGFKIIYNPKAVIYHKNAQSAGLGSPLQDYYITRNRMLFASKFLPFRTRFALFREAFRNLGSCVRRQAFLDFLMGNLGKGSI